MCWCDFCGGNYGAREKVPVSEPGRGGLLFHVGIKEEGEPSSFAKLACQVGVQELGDFYHVINFDELFRCVYLRHAGRQVHSL